jgi:hypothetical protein
MYSIFAIITLIIILIEFYNAIRNSKTTIIYKSKHDNRLNDENFFPVKYNEYSIKGDKIINHSAGQILLKENFNFFIKEKNKMYLAKKNKIYKINSEFTIEILDVNGKDTIYYYIKSQ